MAFCSASFAAIFTFLPYPVERNVTLLLVADIIVQWYCAFTAMHHNSVKTNNIFLIMLLLFISLQQVCNVSLVLR